jgi:hypothetical protein
MINAYRIFVYVSDRRNSSENLVIQFKDDIEICLKGIECDGMGCIKLAQNILHCRAIMNTLMNSLVPERQDIS